MGCIQVFSPGNQSSSGSGSLGLFRGRTRESRVEREGENKQSPSRAKKARPPILAHLGLFLPR